MTATTGDALSQVLWKWPVGVFSAANRRREPGAPAAMQVSVHSPEDSFRRRGQLDWVPFPFLDSARSLAQAAVRESAASPAA